MGTQYEFAFLIQLGASDLFIVVLRHLVVEHGGLSKMKVLRTHIWVFSS